ncbi:cytochrome c biogenesis CcdA family protein [Polycladidibacter stylochi]|uniref:cytochrome c biogenesis CcdA family protein n=1 Tax=Polycladidibacter stylochi TaxID=1807766 RepID=UPI0008314E5F|nr:cytochrome c biogenesis CcdA family protein [Pseudovibrio stylochi]
MLEHVNIFGAFFGGILSFISPCVLPLVPPYLGYMAGVSLEELNRDQKQRKNNTKVFIASVFFVLGFSTVFIALGATASFIGSFLLAYSTVLAQIGGAFIILMGLHFLGVFRFSFLYKEARFQFGGQTATMTGAYIMGLAFGFGWTPCIGPILSSILLIAGAEETVGKGALLLASYSLGIGVPFMLAALFAKPFMQFMGKFKRHMQVVEWIMGIFLIITGVAFLTGYMQEVSYWLIEQFPQLATFG